MKKKTQKGLWLKSSVWRQWLQLKKKEREKNLMCRGVTFITEWEEVDEKERDSLW